MYKDSEETTKQYSQFMKDEHEERSYFTFMKLLYSLAKSLNGDWIPSFTQAEYRYIVFYNVFTHKYDVDYTNEYHCFVPYFKNREAALKAIDFLKEMKGYWEK